MKQARTTQLLLLVLGAGHLGVGCKDLDQFDTKRGETYCGSLVGQTTYQRGAPTGISSGFEEPGWVGTDSHEVLSLSLTTSELYKDGGIPAVVSSHDADFGPCGPDRPLFDHAKVRTIGRALGDRLASMRLGEDHQADVATFVDSTCSGSMVGILSLLDNGTVELRLLRPAPAVESGATAPSDPAATERFGLFSLRKHKEGCGF